MPKILTIDGMEKMLKDGYTLAEIAMTKHQLIIDNILHEDAQSHLTHSTYTCSYCADMHKNHINYSCAEYCPFYKTLGIGCCDDQDYIKHNNLYTNVELMYLHELIDKTFI